MSVDRAFGIIAAGQAAAFYAEDGLLLGGGIII
jgi:tRNA U34 2-thiouridine synthase MnmA/TrmU